VVCCEDAYCPCLGKFDKRRSKLRFYREETGDGERIFLGLDNNASIHWPQEFNMDCGIFLIPLRK
jgi:hypothetical protein